LEPVKRATMLLFILIFLLMTAAFQNFLAVEGKTEDVGYTIKMRVTYSNPVNGTKIWNFTEEERTIGLFMNNTWQRVHLTSYSHPLEALKIDENGNPIAVLSSPKSELKPGENVSFTVTYYALSKPRSIPNIIENESETLERIPKDLRQKYCKEEGPWLVENPELQELAHNLAENETRVLAIVEKFVSWIRDNVQYEIYETYLYPNETYMKRQGACADQATLFITLCRIYGIPAYLQVGCIYLPDWQTNETYYGDHKTESLKQIGWHGWAMAYVPPWGWLPVDLTYVIGDRADPLNAIKRGAVTFKGTIQYLNLTQTDYVASSREDKSFLMNNNFYVYIEDEMILDHPPEPLSTFDLIVAAAVGLTITGASVIVFVLHARKVKKEQ
jgi:hypothetical protein